MFDAMWVSYFAVNYTMPSHVRWRHGMKNKPLLMLHTNRQQCEALTSSLLYAWTNDWTNGVSLLLRDTTTSNAYFNGENIDKSSVFYFINSPVLYATSEIRGAYMMTSSNGNIFRVTGHLCGKFTGPRWISRTKASDAELWCFLWFTPE